MSSVIQIIAKKREQTGKGPARVLRRSGEVPAIIYGAGKEDIKISLCAHDITLEHARFDFMSKLINIEVGKDKYHAVAKAVQLNPVTDAIEHIDFLHVSKDADVTVKVKIRFSNVDKSAGIKRGGALNIVRREIELVCPHDQIPNVIDIDLSGLNIGENVHIKDVKLPENVRPALARNFTIVTMTGRGGKKDKETEGQEAAAA